VGGGKTSAFLEWTFPVNRGGTSHTLTAILLANHTPKSGQVLILGILVPIHLPRVSSKSLRKTALNCTRQKFTATFNSTYAISEKLPDALGS